MKRKEKTKHLETQNVLKPAKKSKGQWKLHGDNLTQDLNPESTSLTSSEENDPFGAEIQRYQIHCLHSMESLESCTTMMHGAKGPSESYKSQECIPKPKKMAHIGNQAGGETSSKSEYFSCVSSPDKFYLIDKKKIQKSQECAPEPPKMAHTSKQAEEEISVSEYFSCVSSPEKFHLIDKKETNKQSQCVPTDKASETPLTQDSNEWKSLSPLPYIHIPPDSPTEPLTSPVPKKKERIMKVYYTYVRMKRGVAVLPEEEEEGSLASRKKRKFKLESIAFPETIHTKPSYSDVNTFGLLTDDELDSDDTPEDEQEEAQIPEEIAPLEGGTRAQTPEWLVAMDKGYRCIGCCRIFPSLESLQSHVEHGIQEGFSCHTFHLSFAQLKNKCEGKEEDKEEKKKKKKKKAKKS